VYPIFHILIIYWWGRLENPNLVPRKNDTFFGLSLYILYINQPTQVDPIWAQQIGQSMCKTELSLIFLTINLAIHLLYSHFVWWQLLTPGGAFLEGNWHGERWSGNPHKIAVTIYTILTASTNISNFKRNNVLNVLVPVYCRIVPFP
jgi:hypothetical protein